MQRSATVVTATRLHWKHHSQDTAIEIQKHIKLFRNFCLRACKYSIGIVLVVEAIAPSVHSEFTVSVNRFIEELSEDINNSFGGYGITCPVILVPLSFWGNFVPALNAALNTATTKFTSARCILYQSMEICCSESAVMHLMRNFELEFDLVIGAALPGHTFKAEETSTVLNGCTAPWNTFAIWNINVLACIGFPIVAEGLKLEGDAGGVEEVATIALFQALYPSESKAKLMHLPEDSLSWQCKQIEDIERQIWHEQKMKSKITRAEQQLAYLKLNHEGRVHHIS